MSADPTAFQNDLRDRLAFLTTQGGDPCARNLFHNVGFSPTQTVYYVRCISGFRQYDYTNPTSVPIPSSPLPWQGQFASPPGSNGRISWLLIDSTGASAIYMSVSSAQIIYNVSYTAGPVIGSTQTFTLSYSTSTVSCANDGVQDDIPTTLTGELATGFYAGTPSVAEYYTNDASFGNAYDVTTVAAVNSGNPLVAGGIAGITYSWSNTPAHYTSDYTGSPSYLLRFDAPLLQSYSYTSPLDVAAFATQFDTDVTDLFNTFNPWGHLNDVNTDGTVLILKNVFGNTQGGQFEDDPANPSGSSYQDLIGAHFDGSFIVGDNSGSGPNHDNIVANAVSPGAFGSGFGPVAASYVKNIGYLASPGNNDCGSKCVSATTRFWVTRKFIIVTWVHSTTTGNVTSTVASDGIDYAAPAKPQWVIAPAPTLASAMSTIQGMIDDSLGGRLTGSSNANDTPDAVYCKILQGWTNATWVAAGKPLTDAP